MDGHQKCFTQDSLALAVWNRSEQISSWIRHKILHSLQVGPKRFHTSAPGGRIRRSITLWPIPFRPFRGGMMGVAAKLQNVPLCDAHMPEKPPGRMRQRCRAGAAKVDGQIGNGCLEI